MNRNDAIALQEALIARGLPVGRAGADGWIGSETRNAIRTFQRAKGLPDTGEPDAATLALLAPPPGPQAAVDSPPPTATAEAVDEVEAAEPPEEPAVDLTVADDQPVAEPIPAEPALSKPMRGKRARREKWRA